MAMITENLYRSYSGSPGEQAPTSDFIFCQMGETFREALAKTFCFARKWLGIWVANQGAREHFALECCVPDLFRHPKKSSFCTFSLRIFLFQYL